MSKSTFSSSLCVFIAPLALGVLALPGGAYAQCDNGVPIGGTACAFQGDSVQYVCQPGSTPGHSIWQAQSCGGGTCQGAACTGSCDNGVVVGGTACAYQGDSVEYVCQPGSSPGHSIWQSRSCGGGTCQGAACQGRTLTVGGNYTDIGVGFSGMPTNFTTMRTNIQNDLNRLQAAGVRDLRIWADPPYVGMTVPNMATRVNIVAQEAAARGMRVLVPLFDAHRGSPSDPDTHLRPGVDTMLRDRFSRIVWPNRGHTNIVWSLGNEVAGPNDPVAFANWYRSRVNEMRGYMGAGQKVVAELVPGSANHFEGPLSTQAHQAANIIVGASDLVSVHYYPPHDVSQGEDLEFRSLRVWLGKAGVTKFIVGEIGVCQSLSASARYTRLTQWLEHLESYGVRDALIWQLMKDDTNHLDPCSFDTILSNHVDISGQLINDGWLVP
ncbi:MAG: hypothetical protein H6730_23540 [Deltaproteobacteria bacterium]|nr:hypothetical protein [Deltaproteobacteria bacterium]